METLREFKQVAISKDVKELIKATKTSAKGIFALHREVTGLLISDNKDYYKGYALFDGKYINSSVKEIKNKDFKPFELLYGSFTLDKVLKAMKTTDYLSFMELYNKAVLSFIEMEQVDRTVLLKRGSEINRIVKRFKAEEIGGLTFFSEISQYFPSFLEGLKNNKIAPNVAKFIFENDFELYEKLNIAGIYDVEHEINRANVRKSDGLNGLVKFDEQHAKTTVATATGEALAR